MIRRALAVAAVALLVAAPPILAAVLRLDGGSLAVFSVTPELPIETASIDIRPESLEQASRGAPVTVLIEAPDKAFDVREIVPESIRLCLGGPLCDAGVAAAGTIVVGSGGTPRLNVTFPRSAVLALVADIPAPTDVTFVVSAVLVDGTATSGTDTVMLVDRGPSASDEVEPIDVLEPPGSPEDASPSPSASPGEASAEPEPSIVPAPTPDGSAPPSSEPSPPATDPSPTPEAGSEPTTEPSPTPAATAEPTPAATPAPAATAAPTPTVDPTPEPTPDPADEPAPSPSPGDKAP